MSPRPFALWRDSSWSTFLGTTTLSLLLLVLLFPISSAQQIGDDGLCACQPAVIELQFRFDRTCDDGTITSELSGIVDTACITQPRGREEVTDFAPVRVGEILILELDQSQRVVSQTLLNAGYQDLDVVSFTSIVSSDPSSITPESLPSGLTVTITGSNAAGQPLLNTWAIRYANDCSVYPVITPGQSIGWTEFSSTDGPPTDPDFCPADVVPTPPPTLPPTDSPTDAATPVPTDSPTPEPTVTPTPQPTDEPTNEPTGTPTGDPTNKPTDPPAPSPTDSPTDSPTPPPTDPPTDRPTPPPVVVIRPTPGPTREPTPGPTPGPTREPTDPLTDPPVIPPDIVTRSPVSPPRPPVVPTRQPVVPTRPPVDPPVDPPTDKPGVPTCPPIGGGPKTGGLVAELDEDGPKGSIRGSTGTPATEYSQDEEDGKYGRVRPERKKKTRKKKGEMKLTKGGKKGDKYKKKRERGPKSMKKFKRLNQSSRRRHLKVGHPRPPHGFTFAPSPEPSPMPSDCPDPDEL